MVLGWYLSCEKDKTFFLFWITVRGLPFAAKEPTVDSGDLPYALTIH
jgi:hypothetical protein